MVNLILCLRISIVSIVCSFSYINTSALELDISQSTQSQYNLLTNTQQTPSDRRCKIIEFLSRRDRIRQECENSKKDAQKLLNAIEKRDEEYQRHQREHEKTMRQLERRENIILLEQRFRETRWKIDYEQLFINTKLFNIIIWLPAIIVNGGLLYLVSYYYLWA